MKSQNYPHEKKRLKKESFTLFIRFMDEDEKRRQDIKDFLDTRKQFQAIPLNSENCLFTVKATLDEMISTFDDLKNYLVSCETITYHTNNNEYSDCYMKLKNECTININ